ncbi:MAG: hypothetical protein JNG84_15500 [Archangium sp.]|nr:hypothetical protein [Archangium sp.]
MADDAPLETPPVADTPWARAKAMAERGASRADIAAALKTSGADDASITVVLNALNDASSPPVPVASLDVGLVGFSPQAPWRWLATAGLRGPRHIVGAYWLSFGAVLLVGVAFFTMLEATASERLSLHTPGLQVAVPGVAVVGGAAMLRGVYLLLTSVRVRRK